MGEKEILMRAYAGAQEKEPPSLDGKTAECLDVLADHSENNKAVLSVFLTLALKKAAGPGQDIRKHQAGMPGGFSARGLDAKTVTPFLRECGFPYMKSGAGALTRSLEQANPYDFNYSGKIKPPAVRAAFLTCADRVQNKKCRAEDAMRYLFRKLIERRGRHAELIKPKNRRDVANRPIAVIVENIGKHFRLARRGGAHLPVLALYAAYRQMVPEMGKYKGCRLCELQSHTAADQKTGFLGDIQVNGGDGNPMEAVEVKHGIKLTPRLVGACYDKFKTAPGLKTYYLLSTDERIENIAEIGEIAVKIHRDHGCQIIVNGILSSLRYYLRLIRNTDDFLNDYAALVERECSHEIKTSWNKLWEENS